MRIEVDTDKCNAWELRRIAAAIKAYAEFPPEGLEIGSGPITVHCPSGKEAEAKKNLAVAESAKDKPVVVSPTDKPKAEPKPEPKPEPVVEVDEAEQELCKELNKRARGLMKDLVAGGLSVKELKDILTKKVGPDVNKFNSADLKKAIDIMGELNAS